MAGAAGYEKGQVANEPARGKEMGGGSNVRLRLAETLHAIAVLPLATLLEDGDALEALEDVTLHDEAAGRLEAVVLGHKRCRLKVSSEMGRGRV